MQMYTNLCPDRNKIKRHADSARVSYNFECKVQLQSHVARLKTGFFTAFFKFFFAQQERPNICI